MMTRIVVTIAAILFSAVAAAAASSPPGVVEATVVWPEREPIRGAAVTLLRVGDPESISGFQITDGTGSVRFAGVQPGDYTLRVEFAGFARVVIGPFPVHASERENPRIAPFTVLLNAVTWNCPEITIVSPEG
jgi:hypothetical protein